MVSTGGESGFVMADIPGLIDLLLQVGEVHHKIRPDLFRAGARKYDDRVRLSQPIFLA